MLEIVFVVLRVPQRATESDPYEENDTRQKSGFTQRNEKCEKELMLSIQKTFVLIWKGFKDNCLFKTKIITMYMGFITSNRKPTITKALRKGKVK